MSTRDDYVNAMKQAFVTMANKVVLGYLVAKFPFMELSYINPAIAWIVGQVVDVIVTDAETAAFFAYIDFRVGKQSESFEASAFENYKVQNDPNATKQERLNAENKLRSDFNAFVRLSS